MVGHATQDIDRFVAEVPRQAASQKNFRRVVLFWEGTLLCSRVVSRKS